MICANAVLRHDMVSLFSLYTFLQKRRIRWLRYIDRTPYETIPNVFLYGELVIDRRLTSSSFQGRLQKGYQGDAQGHRLVERRCQRLITLEKQDTPKDGEKRRVAAAEKRARLMKTTKQQRGRELSHVFIVIDTVIPMCVCA